MWERRRARWAAYKQKHEESCRCEDCESSKIDSVMDQEENEAAKRFEEVEK
jgi:hypothetical protein